jgi:hypothetical protein
MAKHKRPKQMARRTPTKDWYERFALPLDLGFYPTRSVSDMSDEQIMGCTSCATLFDESDLEQMARHAVSCKGRYQPHSREEYRDWEHKFNLWLGCRIKQARLEVGVPESLLALRRMFCLLEFNLLKSDEYPNLLEWFQQHFSPEELEELLADYPRLAAPDRYEI